MGCKSSTLLYGDTGDGKTHLVGSWARWVHKETGKKILYYTAEIGNTDTIGDLIDAGIIDVQDIGSMAYPAEALEYATNGFTFTPDGKPIAPAPKLFEDYAGFAYEGGTSFAECLMEELRAKAAKNEIIGSEKPPQQYMSGELKIAGSNQTHFGIAQSRMRRAMQASMKIPVHIIWTCREMKANDDDMVSGYKEIYGPQLVGQAMTPHIPSWFGRCLHVDSLKEGGKVVRRVFYKTHFYENSKVPYVANPRLPATVADELPDSEIVTKDGLTLVKAFDKIKELRAKATELSSTTKRD